MVQEKKNAHEWTEKMSVHVHCAVVLCLHTVQQKNTHEWTEKCLYMHSSILFSSGLLQQKPDPKKTSNFLKAHSTPQAPVVWKLA